MDELKAAIERILVDAAPVRVNNKPPTHHLVAAAHIADLRIAYAATFPEDGPETEQPHD